MFSRRSLIASTTSSRRAHSVTSLPASARTSENAVPHDPALNTATFFLDSVIGFASSSERGLEWCGSSTGFPISRTPVARGSYLSAGGVPPRRSATIAVIAAMMRSVAAAMVSGLDGWAARSSSRTGSPAFITMFLRGTRCGVFV